MRGKRLGFHLEYHIKSANLCIFIAHNNLMKMEAEDEGVFTTQGHIIFIPLRMHLNHFAVHPRQCPPPAVWLCALYCQKSAVVSLAGCPLPPPPLNSLKNQNLNELPANRLVRVWATVCCALCLGETCPSHPDSRIWIGGCLSILCCLCSVTITSFNLTFCGFSGVYCSRVCSFNID